MGNAIGGTEKEIATGITTDDVCASLVKASEPSANGATRNTTSGDCYAEFGATSYDNNSDLSACLFSGQLTLCIIKPVYVI